MPKPDLQQVPSFYHNYIKWVPAENVQDAFLLHQTTLLPFLQDIPAEKWDYRYADGKWSIKEMVQHLIDSERIFAYRALCIARREQASLPGFDENEYAAYAQADSRSPQSLLAELDAVQKATVLLFQSFDAAQLRATGTANGKRIDVNSIGFITVGHALHHKNILSERYL